MSDGLSRPGCGACRFFARHDAERGTCKRRAPVLLVRPGDTVVGITSASLASWVFPQVHPLDWCGEFEGKP